MTISALPTAPNRNMTPEAFVAAADAWVAAMSTFASQVNADLNLILNLSGLLATSVTSVLIGTGSKSFTVETNKAYLAGQSVRVYSTATPANYMLGTVTSYDAGTGALVVNVTSVGGSGTLAAWTVVLAASGEWLGNATTATSATTAGSATTATNATNATGSAVVTGAVQSGTNPKFRVYMAGNLNVTDGVATKVPFDTESFDVGAMFDSTTNHRFTPTVAGYYRVSWALTLGTNTTGLTTATSYLYKNGAFDTIGNSYEEGNTVRQYSSQVNGSGLVYMNGSTDYLEIYAKVTAIAGIPFIAASGSNFCGELVP